MQKYNKNGILVGLRRSEYGFLIEVKMMGELIHKDYALALPILENTIKRIYTPEIKILVDGRSLKNITSMTSWQNIHFGMKYHKNEFAKLAYIGQKCHEKLSLKFSSLFKNGELEFFEKHNDAVRWLEK